MNWTRLIRTVAPDGAPLSLEDIKSHLAIAHADEDTLLESYIDAATAYIDGPRGAGIALLTQTYRLSLDFLPAHILLPIGPVQSVQSITVDGEALDPASYSLDADQTPALVFVTSTRSTIKPGSVKITFKVGFGDDETSVPADLLHAVRMIVGHLYSNREAVSERDLKIVPGAVDAILSRYRVHAY